MDEFDRIEGGGRASDGTALVKWLVVPIRQKVVVRVPWFPKGARLGA